MIFNTFPLKVKYSTLQNLNFSKTKFFKLLGKIKIIIEDGWLENTTEILEF